ncbi:MAG TPA: sulfotransferase family 2 domain-containing protein [Rhizomicrobium sp.]|jgi:hypothetical protein
MPAVSCRGKNILFVHIPRTGGTSIEHWLRELGTLRLFSHSVPVFSRVTPQHLTANNIDELFGNSYFDYAFTVVRNPFDRIASEYRMRCKRAQEDVFKGGPTLSTWLEKQVGAYEKNPFHLDNHLRPQWQFLQQRLRVFRHEDGIETIIARVAGEIEVPIPATVGRHMATDDFDKPVKFDIPEVERVLALYGRDFEVLGYDKALPPAFRHRA